MTFLFGFYAVGCLVMLLAGLREQRLHLRNLHSIRERIVVNGIRGKSSITRLCAGALRGGGLRTVAKTTGTAARFVTRTAPRSRCTASSGSPTSSSRSASCAGPRPGARTRW